MTEHNIQKWVKALESGKYAQGKSELQTIDNKFCCLGVACDIFIPEKKKEYVPDTKQLYGNYPRDQKNAPQWLKKLGFNVKFKLGIGLVELNDEHNFSFSEIATVLELLYIHKALG